MLIGTHRPLQKDEFKDLFQLVVDEEQRFGVTPQGGRLKEIRRQDVTPSTLSPTPILPDTEYGPVRSP